MINWRTYGAIDPTLFLQELSAVSSPLLSEWDQMLDEAGDHSGVMAAMLGEESRYATEFNNNDPVNRNPLNLRPRGGSGFLRFTTYTQCVREWRTRLLDPDYDYAGTTDLASLIHVYAPSDDGNDEAEYVRNVLTRLNRWGLRGEEDPVATLVFGQVKHPLFVDRLIPDSQNRAWNNLGQRRIVGTCRHTEVGTNEGTDGWFRRGAASTGLTDYGVSLKGIILRWNDPTGAAHPGVSANRAGWANGGSDGLEGDGPLFVRTRGIDAINRDLVSIEREDLGDPYDTPFDGNQFEAIAHLTAHWHDDAGVPWDRFPFNPSIGCVTDFHHLEFATKGCPHDPVTKKVNQFQDRVRALLKASQTATDGVPTVPIPVPIEVDHGKWPNGWKQADLAARWAAPRYVNLEGKRKALRFQANGPLPNAWVARGVEEGISKIVDLPKCVRIVEVAAPDSGMVATMAIFDGRGSDNWAAYRPAAHVAWRWVQ